MLRPSLLITLLFCVAVLTAQSARVFDDLTLQSELLDEQRHYSLYLPPDYHENERSYPVVYLLHGRGEAQNEHQSWVKKGLPEMMDRLIAEGSIQPMIVAMPDAGLTYYMNNVDGAFSYEDFFIEEFIPHIEAKYRCYTKRANRAIAGYSMGGYGAFVYALHHPELFGSVAGISAAVRTDLEIESMDYAGFVRRYGPGVGRVAEGQERITDYWNHYSPLYLMARTPVQELQQTRWYFAIGDEDKLYRGNAHLHMLLRERGVPHEYRVVDGEHHQVLAMLPGALGFINSGFYGKGG